MNLSDYQISKISIDRCGDDSLVIIGIEKTNIYNIELYGYDCDIGRITKRKEELEKHFIDYFFVIKRFYGIL